MHVDHIAHTGRGGAGNVRSPSREPRDFGEFRSLSFTVRTPMAMFRSGVGLVRFYMLFCSDFLFSVLVAEAVQADYEHKVIDNADARPHAVVRSPNKTFN